MTESENPHAKPSTVSIAELAIASGIAGQSITVCFDDYPAPVVCALWKDLTQRFDSDKVLQIDGRTDLRKLEKQFDRLRLLIVHKPQIFLDVNWAMSLKANAAGTPVPSVFTNLAPENLDDDPAATLVLRGTSFESRAITNLLMDYQLPRVDWCMVQEWAAMNLVESHFGFAIEETLDLRQHLSRLQDFHIVRGLTLGACLLRTTQVSEWPSCQVDATVEDYDLVRKLLLSPVINAAERPIDELAIVMVDRANLYLEVKNEMQRSGSRELVDDPRNQSKSQPITRREIVDLGNTNAAFLRRIIEYLKRMPDGYDRFVKLGLIGNTPSKSSWQRQPTATLTALLRSWSPKQVRTHFGRLHREGLITAARNYNNGAWLYQLPESLTTAANRFANLPQVP